jgi:hypothetical protein
MAFRAIGPKFTEVDVVRLVAVDARMWSIAVLFADFMA